MREWSADVAVDEELVRRLIRGQFPELDLRSLRLVAEGWDNAVWLVDERWAFRFPRRAIAIPGVEREVAVVPRLSPLRSGTTSCRSIQMGGQTWRGGSRGR